MIMLSESQLTACGVCIRNSEIRGPVVFISKDSIYDVSNNSIENTDSIRCETPGQRLGKEVPEGTCFEPGGFCDVDCQPFPEHQFCADIS